MATPQLVLEKQPRSQACERKTTFPYCKRRKAGRGLETRLLQKYVVDVLIDRNSSTGDMIHSGYYSRLQTINTDKPSVNDV